MINEEVIKEILVELKTLNKNFLELITAIKDDRHKLAKSPEKEMKQVKEPLSEEDEKKYQNIFHGLFKEWLSGEESSILEQLNKMGADEIRRFADANNLNATSKMSKEKVIKLIYMRFKEKKMLQTNINSTKPLKDNIDKAGV